MTFRNEIRAPPHVHEPVFDGQIVANFAMESVI